MGSVSQSSQRATPPPMSIILSHANLLCELSARRGKECHKEAQSSAEPLQPQRAPPQSRMSDPATVGDVHCSNSYFHPAWGNGADGVAHQDSRSLVNTAAAYSVCVKFCVYRFVWLHKTNTKRKETGSKPKEEKPSSWPLSGHIILAGSPPKATALAFNVRSEWLCCTSPLSAPSFVLSGHVSDVNAIILVCSAYLMFLPGSAFGTFFSPRHRLV